MRVGDNGGPRGAGVGPALSVILAGSRFGARYEMAMSVEDVLGRRTRLSLIDWAHGMNAAPDVAAILGDALGWDAAERARRLQAERGDQVPGDGFAFAIRVAGQQHGRGRARLSLEPLDDIGLGRWYHVLSRKITVDIDAHAIDWQVAHVSEAGAHDVAIAQVLLDRPRLCR